MLLAAIALPKLAVSGLQVAGPLFAIALQAAALDTARTISQNNSTGKLSALPFISLLTNCLIWTYYGMLVKDMSVLVPNSMGVMTGLISSVVFHLNSAIVPLKEYGAALISIIVATYFLVQGQVHQVGLLGCLFSVLLISSPLATLKTVVNSKCTDSLPLSISLVAAGNAVSWTLYGLLVAQDPMIFIPSAIGLFPAALQLLLYAKYGLPAPRGKESTMKKLAASGADDGGGGGGDKQPWGERGDDNKPF